MSKCVGIREDGGRCRGIAINGSDYCHAHDPARSEQRSRAAHKAGKHGDRGRPKVEDKEVAEVKAMLSELADKVLDGVVERADAGVVAQLMNTWLKAAELERKVRETEDLEQRVTELERNRNGRLNKWGT